MGLFGQRWLEAILNQNRRTLPMKREVAMIAKFLAKVDLKMIGLLSEILPGLS